MTVQDQSTDLVRQGQAVWSSAADSWAQAMQRMLAQSPTAPLAGLDVNRTVDSWFDLAETLLAVNREYAKNLARAASSLQSTISAQAEQVGGVVRQQAGATLEVVREQTEHAEQARREKAAQAEQAPREAAGQDGQARREEAPEQQRAEQAERSQTQRQRAERHQARAEEAQARGEATEKYSDMTKNQLQEQLAERELPKSGSVEELRERLVETDLHGSDA